jgi:hypothetical protein
MKILPLAPPGAATGIGKYGEWFTCKLGGAVLPGKWKVTQGAIQLKKDEKKKAGADGSNDAYHGLHGQPFVIEGEQYTDDERDALGQVVTPLLPQPGSSQNQFPLQLQHPSVAIFGFVINVKVIGCTQLEWVGPCTTRLRIMLHHWLPTKAGTNATTQPTRAINNTRKQQQEKQNPPNPVPTSQPGICGPPTNFTPGQ